MEKFAFLNQSNQLKSILKFLTNFKILVIIIPMIIKILSINLKSLLYCLRAV